LPVGLKARPQNLPSQYLNFFGLGDMVNKRKKMIGEKF